MTKHNQDGAANGLVISLVFAVLFLIGAIAFGAWAYGSRQDYKANSDAKVNIAVNAAKEREAVAQGKIYAEKAKDPLRIYNGPEAYGSLGISFPKTWSGYVDDSGTGTAQVDGYFYPGTVPAIANPNSIFALRVQVINTAYSQVVANLNNQQKSTDPKIVPLTINPYALPKVPKTVGVQASGTLVDKNSKLGTMVVLPLRSQTLEIWTEGTQFLPDFNTYILPNFTFSP
ncbi:MAG: hypothetical protein JWL89_55 [Candidatus Saccharibacteria bacterium]|nr:hypothetical protein [Candidatus Saccharibacteria bacterium]